MNKSILNEIDRLEGIALAYARRRPIVPMTGVLEDCNEARELAGYVNRLEDELEAAELRVAELEADLLDAKLDVRGDEGELIDTQTTLDNLMASLGARLER